MKLIYSKQFISIYILLILFIFSSCEKILEKEPTDKLSIEDVFKDTDGARTALAGAYSSLLAIEAYNRNLMVYPDLLAGNIKYSKSTNLLLDDVYQFIQNQNESSMNSTYTILYKQLNNVNNIIQYTPTAIGPEKDKNRIIADAKCLRALLHFNILRVFARPFQYTADGSHLGIVINLKPQLFGDPPPVRLTCAQSYQAIINDFKDAILLYDNSNAVFSSGAASTYLSKNAAKAFLAKVYLYSDNFNDAFTLADEVIKETAYKLMTNAQYVASWAGRIPSSESIFELAVETTFSGSSLGTYYQISVPQFGMYAASNDILNLYSATDVRNRSSMYIAQTIGGSTFYSTKKYATGGVDATPVKLIRLSEIYLIRAEAAAEKNDLLTANNDLRLIVQRAEPSNPALSINVKDQLIDAILLERRKELAFEGNLLFDLLRRKKDISRIDCNAPTCSLLSNDYRLIMPLPANTINANLSIKQNDGYN